MQSLSHYTEQAARLTLRNRCWINGRFVDAASGACFDSINRPRRRC